MSDMSAGPVLPTIVRFTAPLSLANLLQQSYLLADGIVVGHYLGVDGLAAVGVSYPFFYLAFSVFIGVSTGFSIRLARMTGAGRDGDLAEAGVGLGLFTVAWSVGCVAVVGLLAGPILGVMGVHGRLAHDSRVFILTLALGYLGIFGTQAVAAFLRGVGDSKSVMYILAGSSVVNIALVWLFVGPLALGIRGAALATVVISTVTGIAGLAYLRRTYPLDWRGMAWPRVRRETRDALRLGLPVAVQHLVLALGIMVLVWIIQPLGESFIAAITAVGRVEVFAALVFIDLSGGLTVFVAQNLGARAEDRVRRGMRAVVGLTVAMTVAVSAVVLAAHTGVAAMFTDDPVARDVISRYILITYPFFFLYTIMVVAHGCLNGAGRTIVPLICTVLSFLVVRLPLSYAVRGPFGGDGVIWMVVIGWLIGFVYTIVASYPYLTRGRSDPVERAGEAAGIPDQAGLADRTTGGDRR
jgi:putative MATE family efflux protein